MTTESEFFKAKRPWSKIKDEVLASYLPGYLKKVASLGREIVLMDAFAGRGVFEDGSRGSPLIMCELAEKLVPDQYVAIFGNSEEESHQILQGALKDYRAQKKAYCEHGEARQVLQKLRAKLTTQTLFVYLDPFGLKGCDFSLIEPYLKRSTRFSTEIVINMSMPTLHRLATFQAVSKRKETQKSKRLNEQLTRVLGGEWWKDIMWDEKLSAKEKEEQVVDKYKGFLERYLPFAGSCPVREKTAKRVKYHIIFCSRHPDAMRLMNDIMCTAYFKKMHEEDYKGTLFEHLDWRSTKEVDGIEQTILRAIARTPGATRKDLWLSIVEEKFMRWLHSEYREAVQDLADKGVIYSPTERRTSRLNNSCALYLSPEDNPHCMAAEVQTAAKLRMKWHRYGLLAGGEATLVQQVNDGSIVKRFDKTPVPKKPTDVVCPHFLELKWAYGCPYDCAWCYLKGTFRFRPEGIKPVIKDYEKIELHVKGFLSADTAPEILNTGEIADSLMGEKSGNSFSKFITPMFEAQDKHRVLFLTKSDRVQNLLEVQPHEQVIVSFSLNADRVARRWEKRAPSVTRRIEAARKVCEAGYETRIRIDPMIPVANWKKHYSDLLDQLFSKLTPERITLGSLRGLQSTINGATDTSWVKYLHETSNWGKKVDFNCRYWMYLTLIEYLRDKYNYGKVALCKETLQMWEKLGMDYQKIKCNCVW